MKKYLLAAILLTGCFQHAFAQADARAAPKEKMFDHFVGVQLNGLIREVFNFSNNAAAAAKNPYLLIYGINLHKTGWGLRLGLGYNYNSTSSNDGITSSTAKINDFATRFGIEKAFKLSDKWSVGAGIDGVLNKDDDKTTSIVHSFDTTTTETRTLLKSYGGGAMAWLRYHVTPRVLIGTEASFYYITGTQTNTVAVTTSQPTGGGFPIITTTETVSKPTVSQGTFSSPIVFYLIVKF